MDMAVVGKCVSSIRGSASISCLTGKPNLPRRGGVRIDAFARPPNNRSVSYDLDL